MLNKSIVAILIVVLLAAVTWVGFSIYQHSQDVKQYREWAKECIDYGYVIIEGGPYDYCMSWEEAKDRGLELEIG